MGAIKCRRIYNFKYHSIISLIDVLKKIFSACCTSLKVYVVSIFGSMHRIDNLENSTDDITWRCVCVHFELFHFRSPIRGRKNQLKSKRWWNWFQFYVSACSFFPFQLLLVEYEPTIRQKKSIQMEIKIGHAMLTHRHRLW